MGAGQSTSSQAPRRGLHVLRVTPNSPASETTIEPLFDFIIGYQGGDTSNVNNVSDVDATELEKIVERHEGRPLNLLVWSSKNQNVRVVPIIPSREWSMPHLEATAKTQEPDEDRKPSLLGLTMRMCVPETSMDNVWHVLDVLEGSPSESAGLVPYGDWIIGWSGGVLSAESDFYEVVEAHVDKPLRVFVYSYDFDNIREVVMIPNRHWGGEGLLGCVFGFGLLHRIPPIPPDREPGSLPPELFEYMDEYEDQHIFVPADVETQEQAEERLRWEQEEWERENYARHYVHDDSASAANHTPSLHFHEEGHHGRDHHHAHIHHLNGNGDHVHDADDNISEPSTATVHGRSIATPPPVIAPTPIRPAIRQFTYAESAGRRTPNASGRPFARNGVGLGPRSPSGSWEFANRSTDVLYAPRTPSRLRRQEDDDPDGASVAGTEITELSEIASTGSLTSVD